MSAPYQELKTALLTIQSFGFSRLEILLIGHYVVFWVMSWSCWLIYLAEHAQWDAATVNVRNFDNEEILTV